MEASDYSTTTDATSNGSGQSPWAAHETAETNAHPEIPVIGAFLGGFIMAKVLKAMGGGGEE